MRPALSSLPCIPVKAPGRLIIVFTRAPYKGAHRHDTLDAVCDHLNASTCAQRTVREDYRRQHALCSVPAKHGHKHKKRTRRNTNGGKCEVYWWVKNVTISEGFGGGK